MIGYWGYLQFEVNDDWWQYPANMKRTAKGRYEKRYPANTVDRPKNIFKGPDIGVFTFTMHLDQRFNSNLVDLLSQFVIWVNEGYADELVIGTKAYGFNKWVCTQVSEAFNEVIHNGVLVSADIDVTLEEA